MQLHTIYQSVDEYGDEFRISAQTVRGKLLPGLLVSSWDSDAGTWNTKHLGPTDAHLLRDALDAHLKKVPS